MGLLKEPESRLDTTARDIVDGKFDLDSLPCYRDGSACVWGCICTPDGPGCPIVDEDNLTPAEQERRACDKINIRGRL